MKVYILTYHVDIETKLCCGVFSTQRKVLDEIDRLINKAIFWRASKTDFTFDEFEIDKPEMQ